MLTTLRLALCATAALVIHAPLAAQQAGSVPKPPALTADGLPAVPLELADTSRPYMEFRSANFAGWNAADRSMLITTRFGNVGQLHAIAAPMMMRRQITFESEPVGGEYSPDGRTLIVTKDVGGGEFFQLYTLDGGRLRLLTDGKSRNEFGSWSKDSGLVGYSSTRRNGTDSDLYVVNPRDPSSTRMVAQVSGGGWDIADFAPGNAQAIALEFRSIQDSNPYLLDLASGRMTPIGDPSETVAYGEIKYAPNGVLWATSDKGSDVRRLGTLDPRTGSFRAVTPAGRWDVEDFDISKDGRTIAYLVNEAGASRLYLLNVASGRSRAVTTLPTGVMSGLEFAPWGTLGLTLTSNRGPADAYTVDPASLRVTRWTASETGGVDTSRNSQPDLVEIKSFDGEAVSGFLYRPNPQRFPGKRPVIIDIHGGPEAQSRPGFLGRNNYLINELGLAIFYPNVRGSEGYGKRFVALDNGPLKREDSVKDIGAFMDRLAADPAIDGSRMAVTGGSYGGYMCYASAIHFANRVRGALCNVAISNFVTFLENTQSYRRDLRRAEYGDERDPTQRQQLLAIAPLRRIGEIKAPLFVVQGRNDPRVPASEADQVVKAVRASGAPVWYLVGENEGHGFAKKENQDYLFWATLMFWQRTLLSR